MRILHVAAHLGGGIGKAHAAMAPHMPRDVEQKFALLEEPIDRRHVDAIEACGGRVVVTDKRGVRRLAEGADIIQIEYWGHPALDAILDRWYLPSDLPSVCWCHVSGLHKPNLPLGWSVSRFVATSAITLPLLPRAVEKTASVINSGFGFENIAPRHKCAGRLRVVYLGTVEFKFQSTPFEGDKKNLTSGCTQNANHKEKLHPDFFSAIDDAASFERIAVWGHITPNARKAHNLMRFPERVALCGHTLDPQSALSAGDIFFYPLARNHYGTAENALIEAMSLGLVPVVLDNAAEVAIVRHGETGLVAGNMREALSEVDRLARSPVLRAELSRNAMREVSRTKRPYTSAMQFTELYRGLMAERFGYYGHSAYA